MAEQRKERIKNPRKLSHYLRKEIIHFILQGWSPQQITGRFKLKGLPFVCHETIYKIIRQDRQNGGTLYKYLDTN
jgi:IS30 family transposase